MQNRTNSNENETVFKVPTNLDKMSYEDLETFYALIMMASGIELSDEDDENEKKHEELFSRAISAASHGSITSVNSYVRDLLAYNPIFLMLKYIKKADQNNQRKAGKTLPSSYYKDLSDVMIRAAEERELDVCFKVTAHYQNSQHGNTPEKLNAIIDQSEAPALVACLTKARSEMQKKLEDKLAAEKQKKTEAELASLNQPVTLFASANTQDDASKSIQQSPSPRK